MKFYIKDVIEDIYVEGLTPYNKRYWEKFMEAFFHELKESMDDPNTTEFTLLRFASFNTKPLTSLKQLRLFAEHYNRGIISEDEMKKIALKVLKIISEYEFRREQAVDEFLSQEIPKLDEWLGETDWWADIRDALREGPRKTRTYSGGPPVNANWNGSGTNRE